MTRSRASRDSRGHGGLNEYLRRAEFVGVCQRGDAFGEAMHCFVLIKTTCWQQRPLSSSSRAAVATTVVARVPPVVLRLLLRT